MLQASRAGFGAGKPEALAGGVTQFSFPGGAVADLRVLLEDELAGADLLVADEAPVAPLLLISDMDSTMIGQECIDELADYAGIKPQIAAITERAMQGELDFEAALRERVALLAGLDESVIADCLATRIKPIGGAVQLVSAAKAAGATTVLVSGGFHHFADVVGAEIGFDHIVANRLFVADGKLTGALDGPIIDAAAKARLLREMAVQTGATTARIIALGDGANDIPMLAAAGLSVAFHAKPAARAIANVTIDTGDHLSTAALIGLAG